MARRYNVGITSVLRRCDRAVGLEGVKGLYSGDCKQSLLVFAKRVNL